MVTFNRTQRSFDPTAPKPEVDGLLPDVPDGEPGLLPVALTGDDLNVWFTIPTYSDPAAGQEKYELFVDNDTGAIDTRYWDTPIDDSDRYLKLPMNWLRNNDGTHRIYYKTTIYNGAENYSFDLQITLDTSAPVLATDSKLIFPPEVLPPKKLTARYLEQNGDKVEANLPAYTTPRAWDRIEWFWGTGPGDLNSGGTIELNDQNYADPVVVEISGQYIRDRGDGPRFVQYRVKDRAGNASTYSVHVELDVEATPIPRTLPWPSIEKAAGSGEQQTLDPMLAMTGAIVEVPQEAVFYPGERVWVQWGEPGTLGARRIEQPIIPGPRRFQIDMQAVAAQIGKTFRVDYGAIDEYGDEHPSTRRKLQVQTIPSNRFEAVQCDGVSGNRLSYKSVPAEGARLTLKKWVLATNDQWIWITMTGVSSSGQDSVFEAVRKRAVTDDEVIGGVGFRTDVRVSKAFLNSLRRDAPLTGKVYLSFDGGKTWPPTPAPNFPLLQLTLIE